MLPIPSDSNYVYTNGDGKLEENLRGVFDFAFQQNKKIRNSDAVKTISNWYKEAKQYKEEKKQDGDNKHAILSSIANKTIDKLIEYVKPCYEDSIIKGIEIKTHFREGSTEMNCNIEFASIKPFVKFVRQVNGQDTNSVTFRFQLDSNVHINKLQIHTNSTTTAGAGKFIDIDKVGVKLKLTLLQMTMSSMQTSFSCLKKPIKLANKEFETKNISFHLGRRRSSTDKKQVESLGPLGYVVQQKTQTSIMCQRCGNQNQSSFNYCNICGASIQSSCKSCGNTNPTGSAYCSNCGFVLR